LDSWKSGLGRLNRRQPDAKDQQQKHELKRTRGHTLRAFFTNTPHQINAGATVLPAQ
jgi:hypothetical protein